MSWSYDPTDLNTTTASGRLNTVRLLVGDTDTLDPQKDNEEITFALTENGNNVYYAGAWVARAIASKSGIEAVRADTNRVEGSFRRDRFKNPPSYQTPEYE